jgi:hypothetical protein
VGYVIWSIEHTAWWAPGQQGYVLTVGEAGIYTEAESAAILKRTNYPPGRFNECRIPVEQATALDVSALQSELAHVAGVRRDLETLAVFKEALERHFGFNGGTRR